jgi:cation diffusion facilitator family transporter
VSDDQRMRRNESGAWLGLAANLLLAVLKLGVGWWTGSRALLADGANNATDMAGSAAVLIGLRVARRPADGDHRYGHQKAEAMAVMAVGVLMAVVGVEVALGALRAVRSPVPLEGGWLAAAVAGLSILVKELLFRYKLSLARKTGSPALAAGAWDHRSDVWATAAALAGIVGARLGYPVADPVAGLIVACFILWAALKVCRDGVHHLMDRFDEGQLERLRRVVSAVTGVAGVHQIRARHMGASVLVDVTIGVSRLLSVVQGHQVADRVEQRLLAEAEVGGVMVHVEPERAPRRGRSLADAVRGGGLPEEGFED